VELQAIDEEVDRNRVVHGNGDALRGRDDLDVVLPAGISNDCISLRMISRIFSSL